VEKGGVVVQLIPGSDEYRFNYWGYSTIGFFAPMARFSQAALEGKPGSTVVNEFKTLVKECHSRGIEVILDVVFNHTAEGNEKGPTISFRCKVPPPPIPIPHTPSVLTAIRLAPPCPLSWQRE
jgi:pullulanase/glycogen debranching enzyme